MIPDTPAPWLAVLLTIIHIGTIGAVTLCSAMLHRAGENVKALAVQKVAEEDEKRNQDQIAFEQQRNRQWQEENDRLALEMKRKKAELEIEDEAARRKLQLAIERRQLRSAAGAAQPKRNQPIVYDGQEYPSIQAAADHYGISRQAMSKKLRRVK